MTQRKAIIDAFKAKIATITRANGYSTNAGPAALRNPEAPSTVFPSYTWRDGPAEVNAGAEIGRYEHALSIVVEARTAGPQSDDAAGQMMQDVLTALGSDPTLGGTCTRVSLSGHDIQTDQAERKFAVGILTLTLIYRTEKFRM